MVLNCWVGCLLTEIHTYDNIKQRISLKEFRTIMQHLPTMNTPRRDDHIYGAARYVANSLGITLLDTDMNDSIDPPLPPSKINEMWRQARFHCRCAPSNQQPYNYGSRAFCESCSYLIFYDPMDHGNTTCRGCNINKYWHHANTPCIACQLAGIVYCNPFQKRFNQQLDYWLNADDSSNDSAYSSPTSHHPSTTVTSKTYSSSSHDLLRLRNLSIERSYQDIKSRGSIDQTKFVFENLSILQNDILSSCSIPKRTFQSHASSSLPSETTDDIISPQKRSSRKGNSPNEQSDIINKHSRPALHPIDTNSMSTKTTNTLTKDQSSEQIGSTRRKKQERNLRIKENKLQRNQQIHSIMR